MRRLALLLCVAIAASVTFTRAPAASPAAATTYYFAEGTTRVGFQETLFLLSTAPNAITVSVEYQFADGSAPLNRSYQVEAASQRFVDVNTEVGPGRDVSLLLQGDGPFTASREIRIETTFGPLAVSGTTGLAGITGASEEWSLAEGTTQDGFQEYITVQNPSPAAAEIAIDYGLEGAPGRTTNLTVPARSRATIDVNSATQAGPGHVGVSARIRSTNGVSFLVERPLYFSHDFGGGVIDGAHVAAGTFDQRLHFFAEGNVLDDWYEFLTIYNPFEDTRAASVTYLLEGAPPIERSYSIPAGSRRTIQVYTDSPSQGVGREATGAASEGVSIFLETADGLVSERPIYTNSSISRIPLDDGHTAVSQAIALECAEFAGLDNTTESPSFPFLTIANVQEGPVDVAVELFYGSPTGTHTRDYTVAGESRLTIDLSVQSDPPLPEGSFGVRARSTAGTFIVEAPFYEALLAGPEGPLTGPAGALVYLPTSC